MVYKRYIKKDGKTYGPYYQSSSKEKGKVVTTYVGKKPEINSTKKKNPNLFSKIAVLVLVISALFIFAYFNNNFTGNTVLSSENSTSENLSEQINPTLEGSAEDLSGSVNDVSEVIETVNETEIASTEYENFSMETNTEIVNETTEVVLDEVNESYSGNNETILEDITEVVNETDEIVLENVSENETILVETNMSEDEMVIIDNETILINQTENVSQITSDNINLQINTTQYPVVVGMPVKWKKKITVDNVTNISVELPKGASNITVYKIQNETSSGSDIKTESNSFSITGNAIRGSNSVSSGNFNLWDFFRNFFSKLSEAITGRVIDVQQNSDSVNVTISDNATEYDIEYETPAPIAIEEDISRGKRVTISSEFHYENILAYSELTSEVSIDKIKLYYYDDITGEKTLTDFDAYDGEGNLISGYTLEEKGFENVSVNDLINDSDAVVSINNLGLASFITWVVPHLSNQTYEIIIDISNAEHLDSERNFIKNIYDEVKSQDNVWSEEIPEGNYVRVTFEENLSSENDITVYARSSDGGSIEVYSENGEEIISRIDDLSSEGYYKTYLASLNTSNNVFDLRIIGDVEFDYIVDPIYLNLTTNGVGTNVTTEPGRYSHLNISDSSLVLYMPFDVNTSGTTYDYTNKSNDGTLNGGIFFNSTGGRYSSGAYEFDGVNDYINAGASSSLNISGSITISAWIKTNTPDKIIIDKLGGGSGTYSGYRFQIGSTGLISFGVSNNSFYTDIGGNVSNGVWHHVLGTFNGTHVETFTDGISSGSPTSGASIVGNVQNVLIGGVMGYFNGTLDEVMIFNRSLSATEIKQIYNSTYSRFYPTGEMLFQNLNFGTNNTVNITFDSCKTLNGSSLQGKLNGGSYQNFSSCTLLNYPVSGNLTSANLTVKLLSTPYNFYSPLISGNILNTTNDVVLNDFYIDRTSPTITYESPTPSNNSYTKTIVTIKANITDDSNQNTSSFIDFDRSLVGYWSMDSYNSTGVYDNSSYSNFGTFSGGQSVSNISQGVRGNGLVFDGRSGAVDVSSLNLSTVHSMSYWVKFNAFGGGSYGYVLDSAGSANHIGHLTSTTVEYRANTGTAKILTISALNLNQWHYITFIRNQTNISFYVDGNYQSSGTLVENYDFTLTRISYIHATLTVGLNGSLDEVAIFNRTLSSSEVSALYNSKVNKFNASFSSLASGQHNYTLYAVDEAGNTNLSTNNFIVDSEAPQISFISPTLDSGTTTGNNSFYINTTITDNTNSDMSAWIDWNNSLVGYWSFDSYNSTGIYDNSSYDNFGSFAGGQSVSNISQGTRGNGLVFDGVDDYVDMGNINNFGTENFSISGWVKINSHKNYNAFLGRGYLDGSTGYGVFSDSLGRIGFQTRNITSNTIVYSDSALNTNQWYHFVAVRNYTGNMTLYINGTKQLDMKSENYNLAGVYNFRIGVQSAGTQPMNGTIDEVMVFNRTLSQSEISALYNNSQYRLYNNFTNINDLDSYDYSVYAIDSAGNLNITETRDITINLDSIAPSVVINSPLNQTYNSTFILFNVTATDSSSISACVYSLDSASNVSMTNIIGTDYWNSTNSSMTQGNHNVTYYCNDTSGNLNSTSPLYFIVDSEAPQVTIALPVSGQVFSTSSVTFQVTTNENATCNYSINSWITNNSMTPNSNGTIHNATATLANGNYVALYSCTDSRENTNSSKNVSFSVSVSAPVTSESTGGSSGGGGGGSVATVQTSDFVVDKSVIEKTLALNRIELGQIKVNNNKNESRIFTARIEVLNSIIAFESSSITIDGNSVGEFNYRLTPPNEPGTYTGKIIISTGNSQIQIPVIINVKTEKSLYDIVLTIPKSQKILDSGTSLSVQIDLLQMGIKEKMDVTLNYVIKDFSGKVYLTQTETIAVEDQKTLQKEFDTHNLPDGDYVLGVELIYPDGVAVASSQFKVGKSIINLNNIWIKVLSLVALIALVFVIFFSIRKYRRLTREVK